jgi:hypothetical protein
MSHAAIDWEKEVGMHPPNQSDAIFGKRPPECVKRFGAISADNRIKAVYTSQYDCEGIPQHASFGTRQQVRTTAAQE